MTLVFLLPDRRGISHVLASVCNGNSLDKGTWGSRYRAPGKPIQCHVRVVDFHQITGERSIRSKSLKGVYELSNAFRGDILGISRTLISLTEPTTVN